MKTNKGLVEYVKAQLGLPYWYGTFGQTATKALHTSKKKQYPAYYNWQGTPYDNFPSQYNKRVHDCVGLIKGYLWSETPVSTPRYNAQQDVSANGMRYTCAERGSIDSMPDILGVLVFMSGHVGVYIGGGEVIEARGHEYGVVKTKLKERPWKWWGKCPWVEYDTTAVVKIKGGTWNVRKNAGTSYTVIGVIKGGNEIRYTRRSENGWYYLPTYGGWVSPKAVEQEA